MATVDISNQLRINMNTKLFFGTSGHGNSLTTAAEINAKYMLPFLPFNMSFGVTNNENYQNKGYLNIYQGAVPTDFSGLTAWNSRSADILISFKSFYPYQKFTPTNSYDPIKLISILVDATQSGTATWFRLFNVSYSSSNYLYNQIVGSVGQTSSGADLEIENTSIVSGNSYKIFGLNFQLPSSYTY